MNDEKPDRNIQKPLCMAEIKKCIFTIRDTQVMIDSDLTAFYGVEIKYINRAVKRNIERFPDPFRFQLTAQEYETLNSLRCQIGTLKKLPQEGENIENTFLMYLTSRVLRCYLPYYPVLLR
jgi:hypothetical protein